MPHDPHWYAWSAEQLDDALPPNTFTRVELHWEAGFLAGKAFVCYRTCYPTLPLICP